MTSSDSLITDLVASQGVVPIDVIDRLCASGLVGAPPPDPDALVATGALQRDTSGGVPVYRAQTDAPDIEALNALHDRVMLAQLDNETRQGVLKARMNALGVPLRAERLETRRVANFLDNPRPGI